jgi:hypothetical protein
MQIAFDDTTKKKAGRHSEGLDRYRHGAGSARQEYRTLRGLNFVLGIVRMPLPHWPGHPLKPGWPRTLSNLPKPKRSTCPSVPAHVQGARLNYPIFAWVAYLLRYEARLRYEAVEPHDQRRCIMAIAV